MAAQLLGMAAPFLPAETLQRITRWLPQADDPPINDGLAREAFAPLARLGAPQLLTETARSWATAPEKWTRRFAAAALLALAEDRQFENIPALLAVLAELMADPEPDVRKVAAEVLLALLPRSPAEVRRFLRDQARLGRRATARLIRQIWPALDAETQAVLQPWLRAASL